MGIFSGISYAIINLFLLLLIRVTTGIRFPGSLWVSIGVILGSLFPDTNIIGNPDSFFPCWAIFRKRHYLHSVYFLLVTSSVIFLFHERIGLGFIFGYSLHLMGDVLLQGNLQFLWYPWIKNDEPT